MILNNIKDDVGNREFVNIDKLAKAYKNLNMEQTIAVMSKKKYTDAEIKATLAAKHYTEADIEQKMAIKDTIIAKNADTIATKVQTAAHYALSVAASIAKTALLGIVATIILKGFEVLATKIDKVLNKSKYLAEAAEEAKSKINELNSEINSMSSTVSDIGEEFATLSQQVDTFTSKNKTLSTESYERYLELNKEIADLFPTLIKGRNDEGTAILELSGNVDAITQSLESLLQIETKIKTQEIHDSFTDIFADSLNKAKEYKGTIEDLNGTIDVVNQLKDLLNSLTMDDFSIDKILDFSSFSLSLPADADVEKYEQEISKIFEDFNPKTYRIDNFDYDDNIIGYTLQVGIDTTDIDQFFEADGQYKIKKKIEKYLSEIQGQIQKTTYQLEQEDATMSEINSFLNMNPIYENLGEYQKNAVQQLATQIKWEDILPVKNLGDAEKYIETNILSLFDGSKLSNELQIRLSQLFALDPSIIPLDKYINFYKDVVSSITQYFKENQIDIPFNIRFLVEDELEIKERFENVKETILSQAYGVSLRTGENEEARLDAFFDEQGIDTAEEKDYFATVTAGINGVTEAIQHYLFVVSQKPSTPLSDFLNEQDKEAIDKYTQKIDQLVEYRQKAISNNLTSLDMYDLAKTYGISAEGTEAYQEEITKAISLEEANCEVLNRMSEALAKCTDEEEKSKIQSMYGALMDINDAAQLAAEGFGSIEQAIQTLQSSAAVMRDVKKSMDKIGYIDSSKIDDIVKTFPELTEAVHDYNAGLITSQDLFNQMTQAYETDCDNYQEAMAMKMQFDESFYNTVVSNIDDSVKQLAEGYGIDLDNYKNLCMAKLDLEAKFQEAMLKYYKATSQKEELIAAQKNAHNDAEYMEITNEMQRINNDIANREKAYNELLSIKDALKEAYSPQNLDLSYKNFGLDKAAEKDKKDKEAKKKENQKEEIDWAEQALKVLQDEVDKLQKAFDNTVGLEKQIEAMDQLISSLKNLRQGYKLASTEYKKRYTKLLGEIGIKNLQSLIESGEHFDLSKYSNETAKKINKAIDYYNKIVEIEGKLVDLNKEIKDNATINKVQLRQKNNQNYIDYLNARLEDANLTKKQIDAINKELAKATSKDYKYQIAMNVVGLGSIWDDAVDKAKKQYNFDSSKETDKDFITKHFEEIIKNANDPELLKLYQEYQNKLYDDKTTKYETSKARYDRKLSKNNNSITDIQNKIDYHNGIGTEEQYNELIRLNELNKGIYTDNLAQAKEMRSQTKKNTEAWKYWDDEVQRCQDGIAQCKLQTKEWNSEILKLPLNDVKKKLADIEEKLIDINDELDHQTSIIETAQEVLDQQIKLNNAEKEVLQDKVDLLEKAHELRQAELNVQKAQYELEKLKNQKSNKIFVEGEGFVYQSSADDIRDAQANYDETKYEYDIAVINDQIHGYDLTIQALEKQKELWNDITTSAKYMADLSNIMTTNADFVNQVLSGNMKLYQEVKDKYTSAYLAKDEIEAEQESYSTLQSTIENIVEQYELEVVSYEEARQKVVAAIKKYYPEISKKYEEQGTDIDKVAEKQLEKAGVVKDASDKESESVKKSTSIIQEAYSQLFDKLSPIIQNILGLFDNLAVGAEKSANSVGKSVNNINGSANNAKNSGSAVIDETDKVSTGIFSGIVNTAIGGITSIVSKGLSLLPPGKNSLFEVQEEELEEKKKKSKNIVAGKSHSGMELGYLGDSNITTKDGFRLIALDELEPNELIRVLQKGEGVITPDQVQNVMKNMSNLASVKVPVIQPITKNTQSQMLQFNGDIVIQNVQDTNSLASAIKSQLPSAMLQELYKK